MKMVNQMLGALSLEKHPDKTFIGKIERGFDFLAYHFSPAGLKVAKKTIANFIEKASRLYEQKRRTVSAVSPLAMYVRRWRHNSASLRNEDVEEWLVTRLINLFRNLRVWRSGTE